MWMGEQQQLKRLDKKRNFSIILKKAKKFFTSLPQTVDKVRGQVPRIFFAIEPEKSALTRL